MSRRFARAFIALVAADVIISVLQLFTGAQLLPRFVVFVSSAILVPVFVLVSGLSGATQRRRANQDRVIAIVEGEESERLVRDTHETHRATGSADRAGPTRRRDANA